MSADRWLLSITADVLATEAAAFNSWYDNEHLPAVMTCPGFHSVRRYRSESPAGHRYLTQYEIDGPQVMQTPEFKNAAERTPYRGSAKFEVAFYEPLSG